MQDYNLMHPIYITSMVWQPPIHLKLLLTTHMSVCFPDLTVPGSYYPASMTYTCDPTVIQHLQSTSGSCNKGAMWTHQLRGSRKTWQGLCNHNEWTITCSLPSGPPIETCDINNNCDASAPYQALNISSFNKLIKRCMDCITGNLGLPTFVMDGRCQPGEALGGACYDLRWVCPSLS